MSMDTEYGPPMDSEAEPGAYPEDQQLGVDPNSPPADPMLQQEPDLSEHDEPENPYATGEATTRDRVEMCVLLAIETCAKGVSVGIGATNKDMAVGFGQAAAALGQTYQALAGVELKEAQSQVQQLMDALGVGGTDPEDDSDPSLAA